MFDKHHAKKTLEALEVAGFPATAGLTPNALRRIEEAFRCPLPPEYRTLLSVGVPTGEGWTDWRRDPKELAQETHDWFERAFAFDVRGYQYWLDSFGPRPDDDEEAVQAALKVVKTWPMMFPIYAHRFVTTTPEGQSHPVLSVWQAVDSIYYGYDMADYLHREFEIERPAWARSEAPRVPSWGHAFDLFCERESFLGG